MIEIIKHNYAKIAGGIVVLFGIVFGLNGDNPILGQAVSSIGEYQIVSSAQGYMTKIDPTNAPPNILVSGSQNVIINDQERVETRSGYELFGVASTSAQAIKSDFVWRNTGATSTDSAEIMLRENGGILQFYATSTFEDLMGGLSTSTLIRFSSVWNGTELMDELLFVNASSTIFEWSGGQGTISATTSSTIVINEVIGQSRFRINGTNKLRIKGSDGGWRSYTYTGISGNSTFTGVTPDPSNTFSANAHIVQEVKHNVNTPAAGFISDTIKVLHNQVFVGSKNSRIVYVSKDTSFTDFSYSSPRVAGEGAKITFDDVTIGFEAPDDEKMIVFSGHDRIYQVTFEIAAGSTADREVPRVKPLLIASGQGAISQELIGKVKQAIVWLSNNDELVELGQVENLPNPQSVAISDPIRPDFIDANFTGGEIEFWRNYILISAPPSGKVFIFDVSKKFWQPPQIIGVRRFSQYGGDLYGHAQSIPETYKLFTGLNDNGNPIAFKAHFSYRNGGDRVHLKNFNRFFTEMYLASNTTVDVKILYEWKGAKSIQTYQLKGNDQTFLFNPSQDASLGVNSLGTNPLGGLTDVEGITPKYRRFKPLALTDYFEYQLRIESDGDDNSWQILATGANESLSQNNPSKLIQ